MRNYLAIFAFGLFALLMACETVREQPKQVSNTPARTRMVLSWEKNHPERASWSDKLLELADENENLFFAAKDITDFCPKYASLTRTERTQADAELIIGIAYYESAWKPTCYFTEPKSSFPKNDPVTQMPVASEGLLQLSYQDARAYSGCNFDWSKDKLLPAQAQTKTIQEPITNLECGFAIFKKLVTQDGVISQQVPHYLGAARYWSTIRKQNHRNDVIKHVRNNVGGCK